MVADPYLPQKIAVTSLELIASGLVLIMAWIALKKYRAKQTATAKHLALMLFFFGLAPVVQILDLSPAVGAAFPWLGYSTAVFLFSVGNSFLLWFALEVFMEKVSKARQRNAFGVFLAVQLAISAAVMAMKYQRLDVTPLLVPHILMSVLLYIILAVRAFNTAKRVDEKGYRRGFQAIGGGGLALVAIWVLFIVDSFYDHYTYWSALGWACSIIACFLLYVGFFLPGWFRARYSLE